MGAVFGVLVRRRVKYTAIIQLTEYTFTMNLVHLYLSKSTVVMWLK